MIFCAKMSPGLLYIFYNLPLFWQDWKIRERDRERLPCRLDSNLRLLQSGLRRFVFLSYIWPILTKCMIYCCIIRYTDKQTELSCDTQHFVSIFKMQVTTCKKADGIKICTFCFSSLHEWPRFTWPRLDHNKQARSKWQDSCGDSHSPHLPHIPPTERRRLQLGELETNKQRTKKVQQYEPSDKCAYC